MEKNSLSSLIKRVEHLEAAVFGNKTKQDKSVAQSIKVKKTDLDFSTNIRAFIKRHAAKKSGSKKFVLLLAFITKGRVGENVKVSRIRKEWNKMSGKKLLGTFNGFHPNEAKTQGWIDSTERGTYCLSNSWKDAL